MTKKKEPMEMNMAVMETAKSLEEKGSESESVTDVEGCQTDEEETTSTEPEEKNNVGEQTTPEATPVPDNPLLPAITELPELPSTAEEPAGGNSETSKNNIKNDEESIALGFPADEALPSKAKRAVRKKKETVPAAATEEQFTTEAAREGSVPAGHAEDDGESLSDMVIMPTEDMIKDRSETAASHPASSPAAPSSPHTTAKNRKAEAPVLTLESRGEVETEESREDVIWHEIHNAYRTRRLLTGQLGGIEQTDNGKTIAIADYKGFRIVIPLKEMMINVGRRPSGQEYTELMLRQNKILGNMLGAEIDFIVKGIDSRTRSVVASRREAMLKKRQIFYLDMDSSGMYRVHEGRIVQARIIAVAEKVIRVEVFGVECSIMARDLAWDWIGDAHERFSVGDSVLVRILQVRRDGLDALAIQADAKSVSQNTSHDNLKKCRIQSKYAGKVTDVHKGVVYVRLANGVNAVAHSCYDYRAPGKKDDVSFAVTKIDEERGVAVGIITRIIRQNL